jgi:hypothetical protein
MTVLGPTERRFGFRALAIVGAAALLHEPALHAGLVADDFLERAMLSHAYPVARSPLNLFSFVRPSELQTLLGRGTFPWWADPKLKLMGLRPLSSALTALDVRVLHLSPFGQHVHTLLWFVALLCAFLGVLGARFAGETALWTLAVYAFCPVLIVPVGWLADRNALIATTFALAGLGAHMRWRERGSRRHAWLAASCFALALLSGEYALCAFSYLVAYEVFAAPGGARERVRALVPAAALSAAYVGVYAALGYGADGSAAYVDPLVHPWEFASHAAIRYPALLANALFTVPANAARSALSATPFGFVLLAALVLATAALVPGALRRLDPRARRGAGVWIAGSLVSLVPLVGTRPSSRLLAAPALGASVLVAVLIVDARARFKRSSGARTLGVWAQAAFVALLGVLHLGFAPFATFGDSLSWSRIQGITREYYLRAPLDDGRVASQTVVLLNCFDPITLIYPPYVRRMRGGALPRAWRALTMTNAPETLRRTGPETIELSTQRGSSLLDETSVALYRDTRAALRAGQVVRVAGLQARVLATDRRGPRRVSFRFDRDLDDPSFVFLLMTPTRLVRYTLPKVGESTALAGAPAPLAGLKRRSSTARSLMNR